MKRLTSLFLLLALLLPLAACSETTSTDQQTPAAQTTGSALAAEEIVSEGELTEYEQRQRIPDDLPADTYGGAEFRIMQQKDAVYEIEAEEVTGDSCNDAIYNRNLAIEQRFEVDIIAVPDDDPSKTIKTYVTAGTNDLELACFFDYKAYHPIAAEALLNWNDIPNVNQDKPWHNKLANDGATLNGKLFAMCSDMSITSMTYTYAIFFNMDMAETYGYTAQTLYNFVNEGTWTLDKMIEVTNTMYTDKNGDGKRDNGDIYGFGYEPTNPADVWLTAFGQQICSVNGDKLEITFMSEKTTSILEKLLNWHNTGDGFHLNPSQYAEETYFLEGKYVMAPLRFHVAYNKLRAMDTPYSMLPYPKWDEEQEAYYTNADDKFTVFGIPITAYGNEEFIGTIYEALSAESYKKVYPEYFDTALKGKFSADRETANIVDIIMSGRKFDFAFQFGESHLSRLPYLIRDMIKANNPNLASKYRVLDKVLKKTVEKNLMPLYED